MRKLWQDHSLGIVLSAIFVAQLILSAALGWLDYVGQQEMHNQAVELRGFWIAFGNAMVVSLIADTYGALLLVFFTKWFREKYSSESNDD